MQLLIAFLMDTTITGGKKTARPYGPMPTRNIGPVHQTDGRHTRHTADGRTECGVTPWPRASRRQRTWEGDERRRRRHRHQRPDGRNKNVRSADTRSACESSPRSEVMTTLCNVVADKTRRRKYVKKRKVRETRCLSGTADTEQGHSYLLVLYTGGINGELNVFSQQSAACFDETMKALPHGNRTSRARYGTSLLLLLLPPSRVSSNESEWYGTKTRVDGQIAVFFFNFSPNDVIQQHRTLVISARLEEVARDGTNETDKRIRWYLHNICGGHTGQWWLCVCVYVC